MNGDNKMKKKFVISLGIVAAMAITSVPAVSVFAAVDGHSTTEELAKAAGKAVNALLEKEKIGLDQCTGAGLALPSGWENRGGEAADALAAYLPIPITTADDSKTAVIGAANLI